MGNYRVVAFAGERYSTLALFAIIGRRCDRNGNVKWNFLNYGDDIKLDKEEKLLVILDGREFSVGQRKFEGPAIISRADIWAMIPPTDDVKPFADAIWKEMVK